MEPAAAGGVAPVFTAPIKALGAGHWLCPSPAGGAGSSLSVPPGSRAPFGLFQLVLGSRHTRGKGVAGGCEGGRRQGAEFSHPRSAELPFGTTKGTKTITASVPGQSATMAVALESGHCGRCCAVGLEDKAEVFPIRDSTTHLGWERPFESHRPLALAGPH